MEEDIKILEEIEVTNFNTSNIYLNPKKVNTAIRNLINKNKELEKMVELMAEEMDANCFHGSSYNDYCKKECDKNCKKCIIDFFKKKASEENE